jgi:hypothetical protein
MFLPEEGLKDFVVAPPAARGDVAAAEDALGLSLPEDYKAFLRLHDGAHGWIGNTRFELWRAGELAEIKRDQSTLGLLAFGGDGGKTLLAFDLHRRPFAVAIVPAAAFNRDAARLVARSFSGLFYRLARSEGSLFAGQSGT